MPWPPLPKQPSLFVRCDCLVQPSRAQPAGNSCTFSSSFKAVNIWQDSGGSPDFSSDFLEDTDGTSSPRSVTPGHRHSWRSKVLSGSAITWPEGKRRIFLSFSPELTTFCSVRGEQSFSRCTKKQSPSWKIGQRLHSCTLEYFFCFSHKNNKIKISKASTKTAGGKTATG